MNWRDCIKYHTCVAGRTCNLLDTLHAVFPIAAYDPRVDNGKDLHLTGWLREAKALGLITAVEHDRCYMDIGPHI